MLLIVAVFAPLVGAVIAGLAGRLTGDRAAELIAIAGMIVSATAGVTAMLASACGMEPHSVVPLLDWISSGDVQVEWMLRGDTLSLVMVGMVSFISMLIHIYTIGYMAHEPDGSRFRFMGYISLFTFAMLMLATSDNVLQLFFGWEGVGVCSYLLIGYWYERDYANEAAMKSFIVNRVGDLSFALGLAFLVLDMGSLRFDTIFAALPQHTHDTYLLLGVHFRVLEVIAMLLFIGAMAKSAQIFLHTWLPDAMAGPTPISALIHAATMVTAGVFLMARMSPLLNECPSTLAFILLIGSATTVFSATIALVQTDIKKIIAYSTCSELGFMMIGIGIGVYQTAIFLLICHAFFKALLFLCAGAVIVQCHEEQDVRKMGGLWRKMPVTWLAFWCGSLSLGGLPPFAGSQSHDAILLTAFGTGTGLGMVGFIAGLFATFLTCVYIFRELYLVFHGETRMDPQHFLRLREAPLVMTGPLVVLSIGATIAGAVLLPWFVGANWEAFWNGSILVAGWNHALEAGEHAPDLVHWLPLLASLLGLGAVVVCYILVPTIPNRLARTFPAGYAFLVNKWYFDELYDVIFVRPAIRLSRALWQIGDVRLIDGLPNGVAAIVVQSAQRAVRIQTGSMALYAFAIIIGLVSLVAILLVGAVL